jgi:ketosteroid isomerase-like protein
VSQENVEIVLDSYRRFNAGEPLASLVREYHHADSEWHVAREDPDSAVYRGVAAITKHQERWIDSYPDLKLEASEAKANGDQVFAWVRVVGHGAGSGLPVDMRLAHVVTFRDGKITRLDVYYDRSEALRAVGLEE